MAAEPEVFQFISAQNAFAEILSVFFSVFPQGNVRNGDQYFSVRTHHVCVGMAANYPSHGPDPPGGRAGKC